MFTENYIYIVAGDEMQKLMRLKFPDRETIPFCEDLSKGSYIGFSIDEKFINKRSSFWNVSKHEYMEKMRPIINMDLNQNYVLCFGDDECCKANLEFVIGYLKNSGYEKTINVQILNEYNLETQEEYIIVANKKFMEES